MVRDSVRDAARDVLRDELRAMIREEIQALQPPTMPTTVPAPTGNIDEMFKRILAELETPALEISGDLELDDHEVPYVYQHEEIPTYEPQNAPPAVDRFCVQCGKSLPMGSTSRRKFCSDVCRVQWHRAQGEK